jgi:hypothetical protein
MLTEVMAESLRLEGQRFKLFKKMDKTNDKIMKAIIQSEINQVTMKIDQYHLVIKKLAGAKRRMMR